MRVALKRWLCLSLAAYIVYALLWSATYVGHNALAFSWKGALLDFGYCAMFTLSSLLLEYLLLRVSRSKTVTVNRLIANGIITLFFNVLIAVLYETFISAFFYKPPTTAEDYWGSIFIFCIVASFVAEFHILHEYAELVIKQKEENLVLTRKLLKSQINPHFVFNSLSILSGLIEEDPPSAEAFTISLSKVYRYIISNLDRDLTAVSEAIIYAKEYVRIMQVRFPDSIVMETDDFATCDDEIIPTMSIQLLMENAIKHNCPSPGRKLVISISRTSDRLIVRNTLINQDFGMPGTSPLGLGLKNLEQRYLIECGLKPQVRVVKNDGEDYFEVSLPIIKRR